MHISSLHSQVLVNLPSSPNAFSNKKLVKNMHCLYVYICCHFSGLSACMHPMGELKTEFRSSSSVEKWITHYSSSHRILLVGEGNFSFSACLATAFGSASNMVATSLDSKGSLLSKYYSQISTTLEDLEELGCTVLHGVDARTMSQHPLLRHKSFDRIVFNFPHAGFRKSNFREETSKQIELHRNLVRGFLENAKEMVDENGEIHITHKTAYPFCEWEIVELAEEVGLFLKEEADFSVWDYPGYVNKRGSGPNSNRSFPVGACSTFMFVKSLSKKKKKKKKLAMSLAAEFTQLRV